VGNSGCPSCPSCQRLLHRRTTAAYLRNTSFKDCGDGGAFDEGCRHSGTSGCGHCARQPRPRKSPARQMATIWTVRSARGTEGGWLPTFGHRYGRRRAQGDFAGTGALEKARGRARSHGGKTAILGGNSVSDGLLRRQRVDRPNLRALAMYARPIGWSSRTSASLTSSSGRQFCRQATYRHVNIIDAILTHRCWRTLRSSNVICSG